MPDAKIIRSDGTTETYTDASSVQVPDSYVTLRWDDTVLSIHESQVASVRLSNMAPPPKRA